jgi:hypothetical protein
VPKNTEQNEKITLTKLGLKEVTLVRKVFYKISQTNKPTAMGGRLVRLGNISHYNVDRTKAKLVYYRLPDFETIGT